MSDTAAMFAATPEPPYVAVIFSSIRTSSGADDYAATAARMEELASARTGYLGIEHARGDDGFGITVSYWVDEQAARAWKADAEHGGAQRRGRDEWYVAFRTRVATVTRVSGQET